MDFDRIITNEVAFDPDGQVVRSTQTIEETASVIDQSPATVKRHWQVARAWLFQALAHPE